MQLVNGAGIAEWVVARLPAPTHIGENMALGIINDQGSLIAGAIYHNYRDTDVEITFASISPMWAKPEFIRALLDLPFLGMGVRRITCHTHKKNKKPQKLLISLGFMHEGTLHDATDEGDLYIYGMTRKWYLRSKWHDESIQQAKVAKSYGNS